jgi:hypothetical protein
MPPRKRIPSDKAEHLALVLSKELPVGGKLAVCLDPEDNLRDLTEVADGKGRVFKILTYSENDLTFRLEYRKAAKQASSRQPLLVRVTYPELSPVDHKLNISHLADVIEQAECRPVDLRTDAVISHYTEAVRWPEKLQQYAGLIAREISAFVDGYQRMRREGGRNQPLANYHISMALLLGEYAAMHYQDLDVYSAYPPEVAARAISISALHNIGQDQKQLLTEVLVSTSRLEGARELDAWFALPLDEVAKLLVLTDFLIRNNVPNTVLLLSSLGLITAPINDLKPIAGEVIRFCKEQEDGWRRLIEIVDETISYEEATGTVSLLKDTHPDSGWLDLIDDDTPSSLAFALISTYLGERLNEYSKPTLKLPAELPGWAVAQMDSWTTPHHDSPFTDRAAALLRLIHRVGRVQARLGEPVPEGGSLSDYLSEYTESDDHRLELLIALARKDIDALADEHLIRRVDDFLSLLEKDVGARLDKIDVSVAKIIEKDPAAFRNHPHNSSKFLRSVASRLRNPRQKLFVWLFDGMRWDTWVEVVRPVLEQGFRVEEQTPLLTPVPSYTGFARTSFFAGAYPDSWRGMRGGYTSSEGELAARNVGVRTQTEYDQDVVFVTQTDAEKGKSKLRGVQPRRYNFLVFNISDDNIHDEQGDLREVNNAIRQKVELDVLPEMKRMVREGDLVVISSDHGFIQLNKEREIVVRVHNEIQPEVKRRYAVNREDLDGVVIPSSGKRGNENTTCVVGRSWFNRETSRGKGLYTRYDHGGISMAEIVVPGVVLHRSTEVEVISLDVRVPSRLEAVEDDVLTVEVKVVNKGNSLVAVRVTVGTERQEVKEIAKGAEHTFTATLRADIGLSNLPVLVEARGTNGVYAIVRGGSRYVPVSVIERKDKVDFGSALDVFDELDED